MAIFLKSDTNAIRHRHTIRAGGLGMIRAAALSMVACTGVLATPAHADAPLSRNSQIFVKVCLNNAPEFDEPTIAAAVASTIYNTADPLAGASVGVRPGQSCNLRIGGGGSAVSAPSDEEVQVLARMYAQRVGGTITRVRSKIGGGIWYKVTVGRSRYGVEGSVDRGVVSYWVSKR